MRGAWFGVVAAMVGCGVEEEAPVGAPAAPGVQELRVTADQVADGPMELVLTDDVVYAIDGDVPLDRVWFSTPDHTLATLGVDPEPADELLFGTDAAMDLFQFGEQEVGMLRMPGCGWVWVEGEGWVRMCIA